MACPPASISPPSSPSPRLPSLLPPLRPSFSPSFVLPLSSSPHSSSPPRRSPSRSHFHHLKSRRLPHYYMTLAGTVLLSLFFFFFFSSSLLLDDLASSPRFLLQRLFWTNTNDHLSHEPERCQVVLEGVYESDLSSVLARVILGLELALPLGCHLTVQHRSPVYYFRQHAPPRKGVTTISTSHLEEDGSHGPLRLFKALYDEFSPPPVVQRSEKEDGNDNMVGMMRTRMPRGHGQRKAPLRLNVAVTQGWKKFDPFACFSELRVDMERTKEITAIWGAWEEECIQEEMGKQQEEDSPLAMGNGNTRTWVACVMRDPMFPFDELVDAKEGDDEDGEEGPAGYRPGNGGKERGDEESRVDTIPPERRIFHINAETISVVRVYVRCCLLREACLMFFNSLLICFLFNYFFLFFFVFCLSSTHVTLYGRIAFCFGGCVTTHIATLCPALHPTCDASPSS